MKYATILKFQFKVTYDKSFFLYLLLFPFSVSVLRSKLKLYHQIFSLVSLTNLPVHVINWRYAYLPKDRIVNFNFNFNFDLN
jgi:hypothetical protein